MVLGKLPVPGRPTIWFTVGQGPTALTVGAGGGCLDIFTLIYPFSPLSPSLWETARYRLKYCLKGPLNPKLPTYLIIAFLFTLWKQNCVYRRTERLSGDGRANPLLQSLPLRLRRGQIVGQGPTVIAVGAGGVVWTFFSLITFFSLSLEVGSI